MSKWVRIIAIRYDCERKTARKTTSAKVKVRCGMRAFGTLPPVVKSRRCDRLDKQLIYEQTMTTVPYLIASAIRIYFFSLAVDRRWHWQQNVVGWMVDDINVLRVLLTYRKSSSLCSCCRGYCTVYERIKSWAEVTHIDARFGCTVSVSM